MVVGYAHPAKLTATWDAVEFAEGYNVYYSANGATWAVTPVTEAAIVQDLGEFKRGYVSVFVTSTLGGYETSAGSSDVETMSHNTDVKVDVPKINLPVGSPTTLIFEITVN